MSSMVSGVAVAVSASTGTFGNNARTAAGRDDDQEQGKCDEPPLLARVASHVCRRCLSKYEHAGCSVIVNVSVRNQW